jgi:hypothetical protein
MPETDMASASSNGTASNDRESYSATLFLQMAKVIESPRCLNCHPADRHPTQGDDMHLHTPPMVSDASGHGIPGVKCSTCHSASNTALGNGLVVPGNPQWGLAPQEFAWQHKSLREICLQIKDRRRNGNRTLAQIHDHMAHDSLVAWAWHPGSGRTLPPMTQASFGVLVQHWIDSGAQCPTVE